MNGSTTYNDANGDNFLWVRAEADVAGRKRVLVALVEAENVTLNFPNATLVAGKFEVSNNGNKVMIDTNGVNNEWTPGDIIVRCALTDPNCAKWNQGKGQIEPATIRSNPDQPKAVSPEALDQLRARAQAEGNYYTGCAPSLQGVNGPAAWCSWRTPRAATSTATRSTTARRSPATWSSRTARRPSTATPSSTA